MNLDGVATINGDLSGLGGSGSGSATADFTWDLLATPQADGTLALSGEPQLDALTFEQIVLEVEGLVRLRISEATYDGGPEGNGAIATANGVTLELLVDGLQGVTGTIDGVQLYDELDADGNSGSDGVIDGFEFTDASVSVDGLFELGPVLDGNKHLLELTDPILSTTSFAYRAGGVTAEPMTLDTQSSTLNMPAADASAANLTLAVDPETKAVTATADTLTLGLGEDSGSGKLFNVTLASPKLVIDSDPETDILTVEVATLTLNEGSGALEDVSFTADDFRFNVRDGLPRFGLNSVTLDTQNQGLLGTLGLAEFVPLDVTDAVIIFDAGAQDAYGYTDFTQFDLTVDGTFNTDLFGSEEERPFTPVISIGDDAAASTFQDVTFGFDLESGRITPKNVSNIRIGFEEFTVGELVFAGEIKLGGYDGDGEAGDGYRWLDEIRCRFGQQQSQFSQVDRTTSILLISKARVSHFPEHWTKPSRERRRPRSMLTGRLLDFRSQLWRLPRDQRPRLRLRARHRGPGRLARWREPGNEQHQLHTADGVDECGFGDDLIR